MSQYDSLSMNLSGFLMCKIQSMSEFKVFEVDKRSKFLGKAKESKAKREEEIKRIKAVLLLQKNIRAYLTFIRCASQVYPLFIRTANQLQKHRDFVQMVLSGQSQYPLILKANILTLAIKFMSRGLELKLNANCLLEILGEMVKAGRVSLSQIHFSYLIKFFFQALSHSSYFIELYHLQPFKSALGKYISCDLHKLILVIYQLKNISVVNQTVSLFQGRVKGNFQKEGFNQKQSLEEISLSYERVLQLLFRAVQLGEQDKGIIQVLSLIIERIKRKYIENILIKYKIDEHVFLSPSLKEESEQLLKEKKEWKQYEGCLMPLLGLLGHFLSKFYKYGATEIRAVLNIVIELSKLNYSFGALRLQNNEFFSLIERLDFKMCLSKQFQELKFNELFFILAILKSYLQSINDLQFKNFFRFDCERLQKAIRNSLIRFMKDMCTVNTQSDILGEAIEEAVAFMSNLYNKIFRTHLLATTVFEDSSLVVFKANYNFSNTNYFQELRKIVERAPFLMPIETRFLMFKNIIKAHRHQDYFYGQHNVRVRRGHEFQDAFEALYQQNMKDYFKVVFVNRYGFEEVGFDAGGLTKELLTRIFKVAFDPKFGLFVENSQRELMPHPDFKDIQTGQRKAKQFEFVGQLLGKSLYQNIMLGAKFAGPFLNLLINRRNSFDDLEAIDPELYRSLAYIATMQSGVEEMQLCFQYPEDGRVIDLVPRGDKIRVTDDNKMQYIGLLINYKVNQAFERQTWFIRRGLKSVIDEKWIQMFNYAELNYLISGTGSIDIQDWQKHTRFAGNLDNAYIKDFWHVVKEFSDEERSLLLKFVTSCQRPSFLGFQDLIPPFTVHLLAESNILPVSHTCSNVLDLPRYSSREILKEKLLYAIKSDSGFEFA